MSEEKFYLLIVGSRDFTDYEYMKRRTDYLLSKKNCKIVIVSGGARGADSMAKQYAKEKGYEYCEFSADWNKNGKSAGYIRNNEMHKFIAQYPNRGCIAFWDGKSKGTQHNFPLCEKYNTPLRIIKF